MAKTARDCTKITIRDWHDGPHAVNREVSLVAHLWKMAKEEGVYPEQLLRQLVAESPMFRAYMAEYWKGVTK